MLGHRQVEEEDIRLQRARQLDGLGAVGGLAENLQVGLGFQQPAQPIPKNGMVVSDHDANGLWLLKIHAALPRHGAP